MIELRYYFKYLIGSEIWTVTLNLKIALNNGLYFLYIIQVNKWMDMQLIECFEYLKIKAKDFQKHLLIIE